jgi:hypothetical protein
MTVLSPGQFVAEALSGHNDVSRAEPLDDRVVEVHRKREPYFIVGVVSAALVERVTIGELADDNRIEFICNIPREAAWTAEAMVWSTNVVLPLGASAIFLLRRAGKTRFVTSFEVSSSLSNGSSISIPLLRR